MNISQAIRSGTTNTEVAKSDLRYGEGVNEKCDRRPRTSLIGSQDKKPKEGLGDGLRDYHDSSAFTTKVEKSSQHSHHSILFVQDVTPVHGSILGKLPTTPSIASHKAAAS